MKLGFAVVLLGILLAATAPAKADSIVYFDHDNVRLAHQWGWWRLRPADSTGTTTPSSDPVATPEPSTVLMLGIGLLGLGALRRKVKAS
jgi:hypothetical protein